MTTNEIRKKYLEFMKERGHTIVQSSSLVPFNDPTTLFTAAGMQPMINYILGEKHPIGNRIADTQKCFRSQDIEEIGDNRHTTFFEMLGNWSFGDYFKKEQISFLYEFLTDEKVGLGLPKDRLYFSYYAGDEKLNIQEDVDVKNYLIEKGVSEDHIYPYGNDKNWWSRAGAPENMPDGEPGGPDCEVFFDFNPEKGLADPNSDDSRFLEIGNSVFIEYLKKDGNIKELSQKNVDFGGGLTRLAAAVNNDSDIFNLNIFDKAKSVIENSSQKKYNSEEDKINFRIILDHIQAATFLIGDGVLPGNKDQMYFVRRLIRRAIVAGHKLGISENFTKLVAETFIEFYKEAEEYLGDNLSVNEEKILTEMEKEEIKFRKTLQAGMKEFDKMSKDNIEGEEAFNLLQSFGFPIELTTEIAAERGLTVDLDGFNKLKEDHALKSRTASEGMFKGGLADNSEITTALHTCCHLMLAGMRKVLGDSVTQAGSNITSERLRFDFTFDRKVEDEEIKEIENYVNEAIKTGFTVKIEEMKKEDAKKEGVTGAFWDKYPEVVKVYNMTGENGENYSRELCGGPHVESSEGYLKGKTFSITKQEAVSQGVRRFKGVLK